MNPTQNQEPLIDTSGWRLTAANLDAPVRQRQGELLLSRGRAVHRAATADAATTGSVELADLVAITASISASEHEERQIVELLTTDDRLRLAAPVELVLAALRSMQPSLVRTLAATPAVTR